MLLVKPVNHSAFRTLMDAYHRIYETRETDKPELPENWCLHDPMVRRDAILVKWDKLTGIIYDGNDPHSRRTIKSRHESENYEWRT